MGKKETEYCVEEQITLQFQLFEQQFIYAVIVPLLHCKHCYGVKLLLS